MENLTLEMLVSIAPLPFIAIMENKNANKQLAVVGLTRFGVSNKMY